MSRIQSSVGLITGIPIQETVDKLIAIAAQPKELLSDRTEGLSSERLAVTQLSSLLIALQFEVGQLGSKNLFSSKTASSSNSSALSATVKSGANPTAGSYLFTPVQTASAQQVLSQSFATGAAIGAGEFSFQAGGFVDKGISLDDLNGGTGIQRGKLRVTDRSGSSALIDLSFARTVDDVIKAFNSNQSVNVTASVDGDSFVLTDNTGGSGNLIVQDVGGGTTATDLGLGGISVASSTATGSDVFSLNTSTSLNSLNDGTGVQLRSGPDLSITVADGSTILVELGAASTLGEALTAINAASPTKLSAAVAADGNRLELTDLTSGGSTFVAKNVASGTAAADLGLTNDAAGGVITGDRLVSGLRDTLVSSLRGGQGLGTLGVVDITNRAGVSFSVNLSGTETLSQVVAAFNAQSTDVTAEINTARNGILLKDISGGTAVNFQIADGDANETATALNVVADVAATSVNSGTLARQQASKATLLSSLNRGKGITLGDFEITDSNGATGVVDLNTPGSEAITLGDVIQRINNLTVGVEARINDNGDGIVLVDTAAGAGDLSVSEVGNGTAAAGLKIKGTSEVVDVNGTPTKVIDGTAKVTVTIGAEDTLSDVAAAINELGAGVKASVVSDGVGQRLSLTGEVGQVNHFLYDSTDSTLSFQQISEARDSLLLYGTADTAGAGVLFSSSDNKYANVIDGVDLTVKNGSLDPVTINISTSSANLTSAVQEFVDAYNSIRESLDEVTSFDAEALTTGILFGTNEALRVDSDLSRLITKRYFGVGSFQSLAELGISPDKDGKLEFDSSKLTAAFQSDPESLEKLFTDENLGVVAKLDAVIEQLAGEGNSLLTSRTDVLTDKIDANADRIADMEASLDRQRERLLLDFYRLENVVADMQQNLTALSSFQAVPPLTIGRK